MSGQRIGGSVSERSTLPRRTLARRGGGTASNLGLGSAINPTRVDAGSALAGDRRGALRTLKCEQGLRYARSADTALRPQHPGLRRRTCCRSGSPMARIRYARQRTRDVALSMHSVGGEHRGWRRLTGGGADLSRPHHLLMLAVFAVAVVLTLAACSGNDHSSKAATSAGATSLSPVSSASTSSESSASSTIPPSDTSATSSSSPAESALSAYQSFSSATFAVERHPASTAERARLGAVSFDPARSKQLGYAVSLASQGVAWRGPPPAPRASVLSINIAAKPWPTVVISDCPTPAPSWQEYIVKTGAAVPVTASGASPPYEITANVILYRGRWGVQSTTVDRSRTCTA